MAVTWRKLAFEDDVITKGLLTTRGDIIRRGASAPERYGLVAPASPTINYLGVANGESDPTWKSASSNPGAAARLLQSNASGVLQLQGLIAAYLRPAADSTTALQLQNAAGTAILTVDTTNGYVVIGRASSGSTPRLEILTGASSGDPAQILIGTSTRNWRMRTGNGSDTYALHMDYIGTDVPLNDVLVLRRAGNISINTTKETNNLNVGGTILVIQTESVANPKIEVFASAATGNRITVECNTSNSQNRIYSTYSSGAVWPISFFFGATERLRFAPSAISAVADAVGMWVQDYAAGDAGLYFISEAGATHKFASVAELPGLIINESGAATGDLRAESDTEANMLFLDASADTLQLGGTTNSVNIAKGGHLTLLGTARVWDDIRVEPSVRGAGTNVPSFSQWFTNGAGSRGVYLYTFDNAVDASEKEVHFTVQMPHSWAQTAIHLHVHWIAATTAASSKVRWGLEYTWAEPFATFGNTTLIYATDPEGGDTGTTQYKHMITEFAAMTPTSSQDGLSSVLICRLWRDSSDAADTYTGDVGLLYIDAHIELDKLGSNDEYA